MPLVYLCCTIIYDVLLLDWRIVSTVESILETDMILKTEEMMKTLKNKRERWNMNENTDKSRNDLVNGRGRACTSWDVSQVGSRHPDRSLLRLTLTLKLFFRKFMFFFKHLKYLWSLMGVRVNAAAKFIFYCWQLELGI